MKRLVWVVVLLLIGLFAVWKMVSGMEKRPEVKISYKLTEAKPTLKPLAKAGVVDVLRNMVASASGSYGIYVYRLGDRTGYGINEKQVMTAASIMKVPIMAATYRAIEKQQISLDTIYKLRQEDIRTGGGPIEFLDIGTPLSVVTLISDMGKQSDNTAPVVLVNMVGGDAVRKVLSDADMEQSSFDDNTTTAYDMTKLWVALYDGKIVAAPDVLALWENLSGSIWEDRIPKGVPDGVRVVHKIGTNDGVWSDSGIVFPNGASPFVITVLTDNVDVNEAGALVPKLVRAVWDFEESGLK
jgi:beta-lactamase class A